MYYPVQDLCQAHDRMKLVLPRLIYHEHGAFVGGYSISDNILIVQEFMHDLHRASIHHSLMVIKLDMEQAYNRIYWSFLEKVFEDFGFHPRWINWIMACIERSSFAILINGTLSEFFCFAVDL